MNLTDYPKIVIEESGDTLKVSHDKLIGARLDDIAVRSAGNLEDKAFYLYEGYDWLIGKDSHDLLCLVPIRREA